MTWHTDHAARHRAVHALLIALACSAAVALLSASPAAAATPGAGLTITSLGQPTDFGSFENSNPDCANSVGTSTSVQVAYCDQYLVTVTNAGTEPTDGSPISLTDTLPAGVSVENVSFYWSQLFYADNGTSYPPDLRGFCSTAPVRCNFPVALQPGQTLTLQIRLSVDPSASGSITNSASVSIADGSVPTASTSSENTLSDARAPFGIQNLQATATGVDGQPYTQAGGTPYEFTTTVDFNTFQLTIGGAGDKPWVSADPKHLTVDLPPGLVANPQAVPQCNLSTFTGGGVCPADSQVGTVTLVGTTIAATPGTTAIYNLTPQPGVAGELGFFPADSEIPVILTAGVRTGGDYGLRTVSSIPQVGLTDVSVTLWGVPADPRHDPQRGLECAWVPGRNGAAGSNGTCTGGGAASGAAARPFLTMPTQCSGGPLAVGATTESWQNPGTPVTASSALPAMTGCDALTGFDPTLSAAPDSAQAGAPAGLSVDLHVAQNDAPFPFVYGTGVDYSPLAVPQVRDASVALPVGMAINPSSGDGLQGCSDAQIALSSPDAGSCPDASKIGTVTLTTPLLGHSLPGDVFLGSPQCDPCSPGDAASGRMVRLFIQVDDPVSGVVVKLPGTVSVDQSTGQLTATFSQNPQLPFSDLLVSFKGGPRAPLVNPSTCGLFTTTSDLAPWSAPFSGPDATPSSSFNITGCGDPNTFAPSFTAGSQNPQAGAYSPFVLSFQRTDQDQFFSGLSVSLPPGVTAKLAGVPLCSDSDASAGTCPAGSQVGTVQSGAGAGSQPLFLPGAAYLTGPYKGAPYGLAVVVPAVAGPYNLGTVVVRQALYVDPTTAQVTAVSDPFPTQLDGIPLRLRRVDVDLNRPDFMINPTNCNPMQITATLGSTGGLSDTVSSPFQVGGCQELPFAPKLAMALTGKGQTHSGTHPTLTATLTAGVLQRSERPLRHGRIAAQPGARPGQQPKRLQLRRRPSRPRRSRRLPHEHDRRPSHRHHPPARPPPDRHRLPRPRHPLQRQRTTNPHPPITPHPPPRTRPHRDRPPRKLLRQQRKTHHNLPHRPRHLRPKLHPHHQRRTQRHPRHHRPRPNHLRRPPDRQRQPDRPIRQNRSPQPHHHHPRLPRLPQNQTPQETQEAQVDGTQSLRPAAT